METTNAAQLTCSIYRPFAGKALATLKALGVQEYHLQASRAIVLRRRTGFLGIMAGIVLEEEPADRIIFFVQEGDAEVALQALAASCGLTLPGRGNVVCEDVVIARGSAWNAPPLKAIAGAESVDTQGDLASITCTVQRGRGNNIVKAVLALGVPMPQVTSGEGTGLRDKLGLIRIALPAEKEVVHAMVSAHEATEILGSLVDAGRLDQFGSGFIFESPIARGVLNSMVIRGQRHSASIEQLIAAVDDLKGSTAWRKRSLGDQEHAPRRHYLHDLVNLTLICNEGRASELVRAAMAAGAGGATINKLNHARTDGTTGDISSAREMSELVVGTGVADDITTALEREGVFDEETAGIIALKPVTLACTNRGAHR